MASRAALLLPRNLGAHRAAEYAAYPSAREFLHAVAVGEMPPAFKICGQDVWDRLDIDDAIDRLKVGTKRGHSWQEKGAARV